MRAPAALVRLYDLARERRDAIDSWYEANEEEIRVLERFEKERPGEVASAPRLLEEAMARREGLKNERAEVVEGMDVVLRLLNSPVPPPKPFSVRK